MQLMNAAGEPLPEFQGPFLEGLSPIKDLYHAKKHNLNLTLMNHVRESLPRPVETVWTDMKTSDHYAWPHCIVFHMYGRQVMLLLPNLLDERDYTNKTYAERDVLLYYLGRPLSTRRIERIIRKAASAFEDAYEDLYGPIT